MVCVDARIEVVPDTGGVSFGKGGEGVGGL